VIDFRGAIIEAHRCLQPLAQRRDDVTAGRVVADSEAKSKPDERVSSKAEPNG
jgi:hypothetical protein